jgi:RNA 2',3'-cyclic 3'-phosphodiesterase
VTKDGSPASTLERDDRDVGTLRLFLALVLPDGAAAELERWRDTQLLRGSPGHRGLRRVDGFHVTLAFLGSRPRGELAVVSEALREAAAEIAPFELVPRRYRETRSVGMVVFDDPSGEATRLAERLQGRLETAGVYEREARAWLPHATVVRFRDRPRLAPPPLGLAPFAPSEAAAFVSRLHPSGARYEILESCSLGGELDES